MGHIKKMEVLATRMLVETQLFRNTAQNDRNYHFFGHWIVVLGERDIMPMSVKTLFISKVVKSDPKIIFSPLLPGSFEIRDIRVRNLYRKVKMLIFISFQGTVIYTHIHGVYTLKIGQVLHDGWRYQNVRNWTISIL